MGYTPTYHSWISTIIIISVSNAASGITVCLALILSSKEQTLDRPVPSFLHERKHVYIYIQVNLNYNVEYRDGIKSRGDKIGMPCTTVT